MDDWDIETPGASRSTIEKLLLFAKEHRLGVIGSGIWSRAWYERVYRADTYRLRARLLSAALGERAAELSLEDRFRWQSVIEMMFDRCDAVSDTRSPIPGDYDLTLGFAPRLSGVATEFAWSSDIVGLDEEGAAELVRFAKSLGLRAWAWNPAQVISTMATPSFAAEELEWLEAGRVLSAGKLSAQDQESLDALFADTRYWLASAPEESETFTVPFKD